MDTAEIERELDDLESRIDRLRALYEQYFLGIEKMEPAVPRRDVERKIQILRKEQVRNTGQRFKFQMLVQRYNTMQQHWARVTREIENGTYRRDVLRAAARFGAKEALTILGKKKQKQYTALAEAQAQAQRKRRGEDDELELSDSDLLVEDDDGPQQSAALRAQIATDDPGSSEQKSQLGGLRWSGKNPGDPASAVRTTDAQTGVKRRLAELAAAMKAPAAQDDDDEDPPTLPPKAMSTPNAASGVRPEPPSFGSLDLDFNESAAAPRVAPLRKPGVTSAPLGGASIPGSTGVRLAPSQGTPNVAALRPPAPSDAGGPRTPVPFSPRAPAPFSPRAPAPRAPLPAAARAPAPSFGALDLPFDAPPLAAPLPRPLPPPVAPPPRASIPPAPRAPSPPTQAAPRAAPAPPAAAPSPPAARAPAAAPPADGSLPDQRLRQIYAKYVEAKRAANESTAGVTYEKLAETLRAQASRLKASHPAKSVDYDVIVKDGKTLLKPVLR